MYAFTFIITTTEAIFSAKEQSIAVIVATSNSI